ncbi:unnamed protein product, partial [Owenia fusiformis]
MANCMLLLVFVLTVANAYNLHHSKNHHKVAEKHYDKNNVINNDYNSNVDHRRRNFNHVTHSRRRGVPKPRAKSADPAEMETARIIPGNFGRWRSDVKYDISKDIRKNLFFH